MTAAHVATHFATLTAGPTGCSSRHAGGRGRERPQAGAFHGSELGTLNHILVMDRLWPGRAVGAGHADEGMVGSMADVR